MTNAKSTRAKKKLDTKPGNPYLPLNTNYGNTIFSVYVPNQKNQMPG